MTAPNLIWPERPRCHDQDYQARETMQRLNAAGFGWRGPIDEPKAAGHLTYEPFRTCAYCGSMHPEDLFNALTAGATLGGSDWKYGWPHKFYVDRIPHAHPDREVWTGGYSGPKYRCRTCGFEPPPRAWPTPLCEHVTDRVDYQLIGEHREDTYAPVGPFVHGKFYNIHLADIEDEHTFTTFAALLLEKGGIEWSRDDTGGVKYKAPNAGYQR